MILTINQCIHLREEKFKLENLIPSKNFKNFWEGFEYLTFAGYEEEEIIITLANHFKGNIWGNLLQIEYGDQEGDYHIMIHIDTNNYLKYVYKAYSESREYKILPELEKNIKTIRVTMKSLLGMELVEIKAHDDEND